MRLDASDGLYMGSDFAITIRKTNIWLTNEIIPEISNFEKGKGGEKILLLVHFNGRQVIGIVLD